MERVIDRKEYRRSAETPKIMEEEQIDIWQKRIRKFLLQSMGVSMLLLTISFFRFFHCDEILMQIDNLLNQEISISSIQKNGQRLFEKSAEYYTQLGNWVNNIFMSDGISQQNEKKSGDVDLSESHLLLVSKSGDVIKVSGETTSNLAQNIVQDLASENKTKISGDNKVTNYEVAVEGMNQMLDDTKYIKENYEMTIPVIGTVTSEFGVRDSENPIVSSYHSGLDIAANTGTQILAALDGEVIDAGTDAYLGKYLKIQKDDIVMIYAHCSKLLVKVGDTVKKGKLIAYVGNTGNSTGPHLHFELKYQERLVDPKEILEL